MTRCVRVVAWLTVSLLSSIPVIGFKSDSPAVSNVDSYLLGPEDQLSIHVEDLDELSDKPVRVDPNGYVDVPLAGRLQVAGLSVDQFRSSLSQRLTKYITAPQITINVVEYRSQPVSVLGEVNTPGVHLLQGPKRLVDVISSAGGLKADAGSKVLITRESRWGTLPLPGAHADESKQYLVADVSLEDITSGKSANENIEVRANDVISIPRADFVYVVGQVKKSGGFSLNEKDSISLIRALSLAEGFNSGAAPKKARILRASATGVSSGNEVPIDLQKIMAGKAPDQYLRKDDVLFIPTNIPENAMKRAAEAALQIATGVIIFH